MSCNTSLPLSEIIEAVNQHLDYNYVDKDDPRIEQGVFIEPTIRGGFVLDNEAKLDFCGYVAECSTEAPPGKQWINRPLFPGNTLVSYDDGGEIKSKWQRPSDTFSGGLGLFGTDAPTNKPIITGSKTPTTITEQKVVTDSLIAALVSYGLVADNRT